MAKSKSKRKKRSDKFPLTLHPTGQYCKKIKGKLYYFGTDRKIALEKYLEKAANLHSGKEPMPKFTNNLSLRTLCNLYLDYQESRVAIGEIKLRHLYDQTSLLKDFVRFIGPNHIASDVSTIDLQNYRRKLIKAGKAPSTINNRIATFKAMYNWAINNEIIETAPNLKVVKKISLPKDEKPTFTAPQIHKLLEHADVQMKAMIWLGLNCGFGCTDCAELRWKDLDLKNDRVRFPRGKTGISRNLLLWVETIRMLKAVPKFGELVFYTSKKKPCVRTIQSVGEGGVIKYRSINTISKQFSKLLREAGIKVERGVGFYTLRRTAATLAAKSGDPFAVQRLLGHADLRMASTYVQDISEQTDRVINNSRRFIIQDGS